MIKTVQSCRICGNPHLESVIDLGKMHVQGAFEKEGVPTPPRRKVPNEIVRCDSSKWENGCGAIQARHSVDPDILYRNYWYESGVSKTMRDHLRDIANAAYLCFRNTNSRKPNNALDIACNDGTLLRSYPESIIKWGVDPSNIAGKQNDLNIVNECYPAALPIRFDIITTIACFYDVHNPIGFAHNIKQDLEHDGVWMVEVAYWPAMLENLAYDQILAEHIVHYTFSSFERVCTLAGLHVFDAEETQTNGGSILFKVCHKDYPNYRNKETDQRVKEIKFKEFDLCLDEEETYDKFRSRVLKSKIQLQDFIHDVKAKGKSVHILGASTKLNTVLGYCDIGADLIKFAAERSPDKHGAKTLSGINIISEEESRSMKPDYYLVGPYHFKKEIIEREKQYLKDGGKLVFCLPEFEVWGIDGKMELEQKNRSFGEGEIFNANFNR